MTGENEISDEFLSRLETIILENISNDQFGVSELAEAVNMSRSNLLRKVKKSTDVSVSLFIRRVRLKKATELLQLNSYTISEISYKVGFGSASYFIKCFKEEYGYPPGEAGKQEAKSESEESIPSKPSRSNKIWIPIVATVVIGIVIAILFLKPFRKRDISLEKTIAVLPFKNDSDESSNVHIINGLMESTLNNLQRFDELRVTSRTSVEKFRTSTKSIPELGEELNVNYFVEGSGQKIGDQILLSIQLIEAPNDRHLWSQQYKREATDIFRLQQEVARDIADQIQVIITPEQEEELNKVPTNNLIAYDFFLQGVDLMNAGTEAGMKESINLFQEALRLDPDFAAANGNIAIAYYYLDVLLADKKHTDQINDYADKALLADPKLPQALIAKALYYINRGEYDLALSPMELALKYNPNDPLTIHTIANYYTNYRPNTKKYLKYALMGLAIEKGVSDSSAVSYSRLHIANALIQTGFQKEAEEMVNESIAFDSANLFSAYVKAYITYARHMDLQVLRDDLFKAFEKDTTRLDILQEVAKVCYFQEDYDFAYRLYKAYYNAVITYNLNIYPAEDIKLATVFREKGEIELSEKLMQQYKSYCDVDPSIYREMSLATYYIYYKDYDQAMSHFEAFSSERDFMYWILVFMETDPIMDEFIQLPRYKEIKATLEKNFWDDHNELKSLLEEEGLI